MCELFAMSSREPSALTYSLDEFSRHGGLTHRNRSGWGIAYYHDREAFVVKEAEPAFDSPWVRLIAEEALTSKCVIAHVRLATRGEPALRNTHPFRRALGRRVHIFAHNGTLKNLHEDEAGGIDIFDPVGDTDSELAFCLLLERMRPLWAGRENGDMPGVDERMEVFSKFCADMRPRGSSNFLYTDGDLLFVHAHRRIYEENGGFSDPRPPGLSMRDCVTCQMGPDYACKGLTINGSDQRTMLFASVPLDADGWVPVPEDAVLAVRNGELVASSED